MLLAACRKSNYKASELQPAVDLSVINSALNSLKPAPQVVYVVAGTYTEVRLPKGTKLKFYPFSFKNGSGDVADGDTVAISVIEMYGAGTALENRCANLSGNQVLKNGGQIFITARCHGKDVSVTRYGVCFLAAAHSTQPMALYYGSPGYDDSLTRWMRVGNMVGTAVQGTVLDTMSVYFVDSSGMSVDTAHIYRNYNEFDSVSALQWVGCEYPYAVSTPLTNISVTPGSTDFNNSNTAVFLIFPDINAVIPVTDYNSSTHTFSLQQGYEVPSGLKAHLVAVGYNKGNLYFFEQTDFTLNTGMSFTPVMSAFTPTEILNLLNAL